MDQVSTSSLLRNGHRASKWRGASITRKNCHCDRPGSGGLEWQRKVHEGIKSDRDFIAHWANQRWLVLPLSKSEKANTWIWKTKMVQHCVYTETKLCTKPIIIHSSFNANNKYHSSWLWNSITKYKKQILRIVEQMNST